MIIEKTANPSKCPFVRTKYPPYFSFAFTILTPIKPKGFELQSVGVKAIMRITKVDSNLYFLHQYDFWVMSGMVEESLSVGEPVRDWGTVVLVKESVQHIVVTDAVMALHDVVAIRMSAKGMVPVTGRWNQNHLGV